MSKIRKIYLKLMNGKSDSNFEFSDIIILLKYLGFELRIKGSHHIFRLSKLGDKINIQKDGHLMKRYQVKQIRQIIKEHNLGDKINE